MKIFQLIEYHAEDAHDDPECYGNTPNSLHMSFNCAMSSACEAAKQSAAALDIVTPRVEFVQHRVADYQRDHVSRWWSCELPGEHDIEFTIYQMDVV